MKKGHRYFVYIVANKTNRVLYVGMTNDLARRADEHSGGEGSEFTVKYNVNKLVYYEEYQYVHDAIEREHQMKKWKRAWKIKMIEEMNPEWEDLEQGLAWQL